MVKMATKRSRKQRAANRHILSQRRLAKLGNGGNYVAAAKLELAATKSGLLRRIFKLARGTSFTAQERTTLVMDIAKRISDTGVNPKIFNVNNAWELAELFVKDFEAMEISPRTFRSFAANARIKGYQSSVRGKLFHRFVRNFKPLQDDLKSMAKHQVIELNNAPLLVNARGTQISKFEKFGAPRKASKTRIRKKDGTVVEYIDELYTSSSGKDNSQRWSFLVEYEIKTAASAKDFGKQIGWSQLRAMMNDVEEIEMVVEGIGRVKVKPENLVYSPRSINRIAITLLSSKRWARIKMKEQVELSKALATGDAKLIYSKSGFRFQSTAKGMGETFLRVTLAMGTDDLNKIVNAVLPILARK